MQRLISASKKAIGFKQSMKALEKGLATVVYIAADAEEKIKKPLIDACQDNNVPLVTVDSMMELGKASGIQVKASAAVVMEKANKI